ncbi:undecaprenyl-diphosphate phosphatase [Maritalea porphyrae]|uniref:Undecaprenyl-diphosphatase n=1 Tax=Maritalea porphyrae TaxID=880732 RepID=A0ABQ5UTG9_9HYPH|nr:undecaprenyl-diphosphate phosphatase [Maritalea porphyrae]GLQ17257.1 undecaprenyl-diphosphatase 1 [Maritalea porphyrae]
MAADQGIFVPLLLGIVEGLTEFLPVSSTAHILLLGEWLGFENPGSSFEVLIQLGAILAIVTIYFKKLLDLAIDALRGKPYALKFALGVLLASVPAALAGVMLHGYIKTVLYNTPLIICSMLITGGIILLIVDRMKLKPKYTDIYEYPLPLCFSIGIFQMLALVPGVSRSGATIVGSMLMGTDKRSAAEFTFFIALPIMTGAFGYDLYKNIDLITFDAGLDIAVGFAAAFIVGAIVVRYLLDFVSKYGFALFGWWRIIAGVVGLFALGLVG